MAKIKISQSGDLSKTFNFLNNAATSSRKIKAILDKYGKRGVDALREATPKKTGKTSESWSYEVRKQGSEYEIVWKNSNENKGRYVAVLIQYGHGLPQGGYVRGVDFINPALKPLFESFAVDAWLEVTSK